MRYLVYASAIVASVAVYALFHSLSEPPLRTHYPREKRACIMQSLHPMTFHCSDGRGYVVQDGRWVDIGPVTALPGAPAR